MSYPGPVGYTTNLGCDMGNQRAIDQFNFVVDNGGADPAPTVPNNLQSPASVLPAANGASSLIIASGNAGASLSVITSGANISTIDIGTSNASASSVLSLNNGNYGSSTIQLGNAGGSNSQVSLEVDNLAPTLFIKNVATPATYLSVDTVNNAVTLCDGAAAAPGTINLNAATSISDAAGGANLLALSPTSTTASLIVQDPVGGTGTISIGPSAAESNLLQLSSVPRTNTTAFVKVGASSGSTDGTGIVLKGSQTASPFCAIFCDTAGPGGQLNLSSNNINNNGLGSGVSVQDAGLILTNPIDYNFSSNQPAGYSIITGSINGGVALVTGSYYPLINNPPALGGSTGLYCIMLIQTTTGTAVINNAQVSTIAYWNGPGGVWNYGGSAIGSPMTGGSVHIGFGPTSTTKTTLYVGYGATDNGCILQYVMVPLFQSLAI